MISRSKFWYITNEIRRFCINNELFTYGTTNQYNKMFDLSLDKNVSDEAIASIIYVCSYTELTRDQIEDKIEYIRQVLYIED